MGGGGGSVLGGGIGEAVLGGGGQYLAVFTKVAVIRCHT